MKVYIILHSCFVPEMGGMDEWETVVDKVFTSQEKAEDYCSTRTSPTPWKREDYELVEMEVE